MLNQIIARVSLESTAPYCQSRYHCEPKLEGETPEDYEKRTWRFKAHVNDKNEICIPAGAIHNSLVDAAAYSKRQIPGQGAKTWTQKFASGIAIFENINLGIDVDSIGNSGFPAHVTGDRKSGKRVPRLVPQILNWTATFDIIILDPIIKEDILIEMLEQAGMFIGIGQNRPQNRGIRGRFKVIKVEWLGQPGIDKFKTHGKRVILE